MSEGDRRAAADPRLLRDAQVGDDAVRLRFASVERPVYEQAYNVIANPFLWFLQHQMWNLPERPIIDAGVMRAWERGYVALNEAFARAIVAQARGDRRPRIMLHDYHLYLRRRADPPRSPAARSSATSPTSRGRPRRSGRRSRRPSARASPPGSSPTTSSASRPIATRTTSCAWSSRSCPKRRSTTRSPRCGVGAGRRGCGRTRSASTSRRRAGSPLARRPAPGGPAARRRDARAGHRPRRPARAVEEHPARLPRLRGAPPAPAAAARPDQLPRLPRPVAHRPARVRPLRARGAERGRPHQRPIRPRRAGARSSSSTRTTTPRRWPGSRSPTSCSSTRSSTA